MSEKRNTALFQLTFVDPVRADLIVAYIEELEQAIGRALKAPDENICKAELIVALPSEASLGEKG